MLRIVFIKMHRKSQGTDRYSLWLRHTDKKTDTRGRNLPTQQPKIATSLFLFSGPCDLLSRQESAPEVQPFEPAHFAAPWAALDGPGNGRGYMHILTELNLLGLTPCEVLTITLHQPLQGISGPFEIPFDSVVKEFRMSAKAATKDDASTMESLCHFPWTYERLSSLSSQATTSRTS